EAAAQVLLGLLVVAPLERHLAQADLGLGHQRRLAAALPRAELVLGDGLVEAAVFAQHAAGRQLAPGHRLEAAGLAGVRDAAPHERLRRRVVAEVAVHARRELQREQRGPGVVRALRARQAVEDQVAALA